MKAALLAILVGQLAEGDAGTVAPDAGTGWNAPLYSECPVTPAKAERTDAGYWIVPDVRMDRIACLMETCRAHDEKSTGRLLTEPSSLLPWWFPPTVTALLGLGLGIVAGYAIARTTTGSP